jgi:hypothetical protein
MSKYTTTLTDAEIKQTIIINDLKLKLQHVEMELDDITERYESLCSKLKHNANDTRNEDER